MILLSETDFADAGVSISRAFVEARKSYSRELDPAAGPVAIIWERKPVILGDLIPIPTKGVLTIELISRNPNNRQGMDVEIPAGAISLPDGAQVPILRTWFDKGLSDIESYRYETTNGIARTCNVYETKRGSHISAERWTRNAGMRLVSQEGMSRVYECNHGSSTPPSFTDLVYRLTFTADK